MQIGQFGPDKIKEEQMQEREMAKRRVAETLVVIKNAGLSPEAREMFNMIAERAYEIFESKGRTAGRDMEHWLQAEAELFERKPINFKESPEGVIILADVTGFSPKELEVDLEPKRIIIIGKHQTHSEHSTHSGTASEMRSHRLLRTLQLPVEIDTRRVTAKVHGGVLELDVRKALAAQTNSAGNVA
jgi:HSP20 family molecular chaperone IbpA